MMDTSEKIFLKEVCKNLLTAEEYSVFCAMLRNERKFGSVLNDWEEYQSDDDDIRDDVDCDDDDSGDDADLDDHPSAEIKTLMKELEAKANYHRRKT